MNKNVLFAAFIAFVVGVSVGFVGGGKLNFRPLIEKGECIGWCQAHRWETGEFSAGDCWCVRKNEKRLRNGKGRCK